MKTKVDVSEIFQNVMTHVLNHVGEKHGEKAMHRLFFEFYSYAFGFLEREFGFEAVRAFWEEIADRHLGPLEELMKTKGFRGMEEYWRTTLKQEDADYEMKVTDDCFELRVKHCPPTKWFKARNLPAYPRYCEHCRVLYSRVGERCGFAMEYFPPDDAHGICCGLRFTRKGS